jgi:hypothetical protein
MLEMLVYVRRPSLTIEPVRASKRCEISSFHRAGTYWNLSVIGHHNYESDNCRVCVFNLLTRQQRPLRYGFSQQLKRLSPYFRFNVLRAIADRRRDLALDSRNCASQVSAWGLLLIAFWPPLRLSPAIRNKQ